MEDDAVRPSLPLAAVTTVLLAVALTQGDIRASAVATSSAPAGAGVVHHLGCAASGTAPRRARAVLRTDPALFAAAGRRTGQGTGDPGLAGLAADPTLYLDGCGRPLYAEPRLSPADRARLGSGGGSGAGATAPAGRAAATATQPLSQTFALASRPGAARTIYLDFTGETIAGTAWNASYSGGDPIVVPPYSLDADASTFSTGDLAEIQKVWQIVAEDYAPFDVNVTTADPGSAALQRTSGSDTAYGARVVVAGGSNPVSTACGCGGIAYIGVFDASGADHDYYQPAWVFTGGVGLRAKGIGEAASHEAGHLFGLYHDGTASASYYSGATPWAPIMGAGYYQPVTQWSAGEYPGANQLQDDVAVIAAGGAPLRTDDVGDTAATATPLTALAPGEGVISTRGDVDAWSVVAAGSTTVTVTSPAFGDLDAQLTITDAAGTVVARANPAVGVTNASVATGLGAGATFTAPATGATYTASVDGVGQGSTSTAGGYSDYASLGNYEITLATQTASTPPPTGSPAPLTVTAGTLPTGVVGTPYAATPVAAAGGTAPYAFTASGLPAGLTMSAATGAISGTPTSAGTASVVVTVTDALGQRAATAPLALVVGAPPTVAPLAITTATLPGAQLNRTYSASILAAGGTAPYRWSYSGTLPAGLRLSVTLQGQLLLSGRPRARGTSTFTVIARDALAASATRTFSLNVS